MQWIPISEKLEQLPPCTGTYLVQYVWDDKPDVSDYYPTDDYEDDMWVDSREVAHRNKDVKAWMELPEPYKED